MKQIAVIIVVFAVWMDLGAGKPSGDAAGNLGANGQAGENFALGGSLGGSDGINFGVQGGAGGQGGLGGPPPRGNGGPGGPGGPPGGGLISALKDKKANCRRAQQSTTRAPATNATTAATG